MNTQTAETTTSTAKAETASAQTETTEKEVTLDDVYRDAGLDKVEQTQQSTQQTTQQQTSTTQQTQKVEPSSIPDPYDTENFKAYLAREASGKTELLEAVKGITGFLNAQAQKAAVESTRADIEKAVSTINEVVGHPKSKVIEAALDGAVRDDPRLKAIWNNRGKNPTAWNNALKIVTKQIAEDFSVKVDPDLQRAQRARKDSQKTMATTSQDTASPVEEELASSQGEDFDRAWQRLKGGN